MQTLYLNRYQTDKAAKILIKGGIVAVPTETVYGLAADAFNERAILKIFDAKGRPSDNPLIVHIADLKDIYKVVSDFPLKAKKLAEKFWPGPLTMILPKNQEIPFAVSAGMDCVAVRFPSNKIAQDIIKKAGVPLVMPSANLSGKPSATKFRHVCDDLNGKVDAIVDGGDCYVGIESTVVSLLEDVPCILRPGAITPDDLEKAVGKVKVDKTVYEKLKPGQKVLSPGIKYKHYAPNAQVFIVKGTREKYANFVNSKDNLSSVALCFDEDIPFIKIPYISYGSELKAEQQAYNLFDALRKADEMKAKTVYAHFKDSGGVSMAVYNRLIRAAGFQIIEL